MGVMSDLVMTYETARNLTANGFSRAGYSFAGWATSADGNVAYTDGASVKNLTTTQGAIVTLYAKWTANTYTVTFDRQGGRGGTASVTAIYGAAMPSITVPTRSGYTFGGYYTSTGGSGTQYYTASGASARTWDKTSATTLFAKWTANAVTTYTITYKPGANGIGSMQAATKTQGTALTLKGAIFTRTGYTQTGWATSDGGAKVYDLGASYTANAAETLYPIWTANTYTVTYVLGSGTHGATHPSSATYDTAFYVSAPSRSGYTFAGWAVTSGLNTSTAKWGTTSSPSTSLTSTSTKCVNGATGNVYFKNLTATAGGSITLTANWTAVPATTYIITYAPGANGTGSQQTATKTQGAALTLRGATFTRTGYTQTGWATSDGGAKVYDLSSTYTANVAATLYPFWMANTYTVTYALGGGAHGATHPSSASYDTAFYVSAPSRAGYTFAGWAVTSGLNTSTAKWGTTSSPSTSLTSTSTKCVNGATGNVYFKNLTATAVGSITLTANWTAVPPSTIHKVTFDSNGGTLLGAWSATREVEHGAEIGSLPSVSRTGYEFGGWFYSLSGGTRVTYCDVVTQDMTVYVHWKPITYSISFDANGGTGTMMADLVMTYDTGKNLSINGFVRTGYTFAGWATSASGNMVYADGASVNNLAATQGAIVMLYAKWTANTYMVTLDSQGGSGGTASVTATYGAAMPSVTPPTRSGYTFGGYYSETDGNGTQYYTSSGTSTRTWDKTRATTLYAKWTAMTMSTIIYKPGDYGVGQEQTDTKTNGVPLKLKGAIFTRTGYTQTGWTTRQIPKAGSITEYALYGIYTENPLMSETFYPIWTANTYTVTYALGGGAHGATHPSSASYDTAFYVSAPSRAGYTFAGWAVTSGLNTSTAKWGTTSSPSTSLTSTSTKCVNGATGNVYFKNLTATAGGSITLTANWTAVPATTYIITYAPGANGTGSQQTATKTQGAALTLRGATFTRTGYTQTGWATSDGGAKAYNLSASYTTNAAVTLYPFWTANAYTVTLDGQSGSGGTASVTAIYGAAMPSITVPTRTGYTFGGYYTSTGGSGTQYYTASGASARTWTGMSATTLYAKWVLEEGWDPDVIRFDTESAYETNESGTLDLQIGGYVGSATTPKLTVKGLPVGLKYDAATMTISGKATKPGVYTVTVSATNATVKKPVTTTFEIVVPNLTSERLPGLEPERYAYGTIHCGVAFDPGLVDCSPEDGWTVKAAGLPVGLKYNAKTGEITGVPTKAGTYTVTFTATKKGEASQVATITLDIAPLPAWAAGTFTGYIESVVDGAYGFATMTVAANGKISGKIALDGTKWTFSAPSYAFVESPTDNADDATFILDAVAKAGKETMPVSLAVSRIAGGGAGEASGDALANARVSGTLMVDEVRMWRSMWKDKATAADAKAVLAEFAGAYTLSFAPGEDCGSGYLSLTVGKNGDVKATGKLADGTSVSATSPLVYDEEAGWFAILHAAPSAYKGGAFVAGVGFDATDAAVAGRPPYRLEPALFTPWWESRNPQATGEYGAGFVRTLDFTGAYYNKLDTLGKYYDSMRIELGGAPALGYSFKRTYIGDDGRKASDTAERVAAAVDTSSQEGMVVSVDEKGRIVAAKATKPVQDRETKECYYDGANDGALTLSFVQATGIFKGSYTFWYDYVSASDETTGKDTYKHVAKKVNFEGIIVQGEESMRGFYLWDATGAYADPKSGREKTYKYKESHPVSVPSATP